MGSYYGTCEIVEASKELNPRVVKLGYKGSLEDDINRLFDAINLKGSKGLGASSSALKKNALKKPITVGMPHSPGIGASEQLSLKQALRDLCISKASEMAAMKRLSMSTGSPRLSEAGRIKSLLNSVVVDATSGAGHPRDEDKGSMVEVSLVPEESKSSCSRIMDVPLQATTNKSPSRNDDCSSQLAFETTRIGTGTSSSTSRDVGIQAPKANDTALEPDNTVPASTKVPKSASMSKSGRRGRLKYAAASSSGSTNRNRVSRMTSNEPRVTKMTVRGKTSVETKMKQGSLSVACADCTFNEVNSSLDSTKSQLVCHRCQCSMKSSSNESNQDSKKLQSDEWHKLDLIEHNGNLLAIPMANKTPKSRAKGDLSQCSNSHGDSASTSIGNDSSLRGSNCSNRPHMSTDAKWEAIRQIRVQEGVLGLRHFNLLKKLGCGDIGTVYLAELIGTNCLFAIKVMDNEYLARRKKLPRAQTEREILRILDHPFLPTLYTQFTSDNLSCLVMEYCPGGDLHVLRQRQHGRCFPEAAARFYVAEVILALEYLHMLGVIYRDLKPENILVREDGHIMLTDFDLSLRCTVSPTLLKSPSNIDAARISGACTASSCAEPFCIAPSCQVSCFGPKLLPTGPKTAKTRPQSLPQLVAEPTDARSNSFVGTHEYLAPEIIKGEGHGAAVDWWTFGIFLYELLYGRTPFKGAGNEETLANVVWQSLKFPDDPLVSFQARDLIRGLLAKEPENRLGTEKGAAEIKQHPFFEGLNWALIRCAVPPELPAFYEFGAPSMVSPGTATDYLECKATGEHLEFELF